VTATAIILARAGSKGLPGKNVAPVAGIPCVIWTIEHALASETVSRVVVSSDDHAVLAIAQIWGVETVERPPELAHDTARIDDAARDAFAAIGEPEGPVVILYANVPVRPDDLTDRAVRRLLETRCDSVQSYAGVGKYHPWWTARVDDTTGQVRPWEGDVLNHNVFRRQDLPPALVPDGGVIACTPQALMLRLNAPEGPHAFFGLDRRGVITAEGEVVDIDSPADRMVAEAALAEKRNQRGRTAEHAEGAERRRGADRSTELVPEGLHADLTHAIIGCAMRVHTAMGPGLLESVYELCLLDELRRTGMAAERQVGMDVAYADRTIAAGFRADLLVENRVIVEIKAVERLTSVHEAQLLTYLRLSSRPVGLLMNFNAVRLKDGIKRLVLNPNASSLLPSAPSACSAVRPKDPAP
tara:strand:- start:7084 stop:8322 length:1239 start_codon:yes stop_codon:yes gene_type:complete